MNGSRRRLLRLIVGSALGVKTRQPPLVGEISRHNKPPNATITAIVARCASMSPLLFHETPSDGLVPLRNAPTRHSRRSGARRSTIARARATSRPAARSADRAHSQSPGARPDPPPQILSGERAAPDYRIDLVSMKPTHQPYHGTLTRSDLAPHHLEPDGQSAMLASALSPDRSAGSVCGAMRSRSD